MMLKSCLSKRRVFSPKTIVLILGVLFIGHILLIYSIYHKRGFGFLNQKFERETFSQKTETMNFEKSKREYKASVEFGSKTRKKGTNIIKHTLSRKVGQKWENIQTSTPTDIQEKEAELLVRRLLPDHSHLIRIRVVGPNFSPKNRDRVSLISKSLSSHEVVNLDTSDKKELTVTANTGVAAIWGLNHYLKYFCNSHISWDTSRVEIPDPLPEINITLTSVEKFRYYMNVCTFGYTFAFWKWPQWEKHIDWMALNGINVPLAFVGQEAIWERVYTKFGLTPNDLSSHFAGPAFLPWQRMGNINKWGGPLSPSWHQFTIQLQHQILGRMRRLGMTPVLPAFAGHIPEALVSLYPNITYYNTKFVNFPPNKAFHPTYLLGSNDPLFRKIGASFIKEYINEFGETDNLYNADAFNEMTPARSDLEFIRRSGEAIYEAITDVDKDAVWLIQGWTFKYPFWRKKERVKALLLSIDLGSMIVLDLVSTTFDLYKRLDSFFGQPFIFNDINNFGGNIGIFGRIDRINQRLLEARKMENSSIIGIGIAPEGLSGAYSTSELLLEMSWRREPVNDMEGWFANYSRRRYGKNNESAKKAWNVLIPNVLNATCFKYFGKMLLVTHLPSLDLTDFVWYDVSEIAKSLDYFIDASDELNAEEGYRFDLVDITRQFLVNLAPKFYDLATDAYRKRDVKNLKLNAYRFLDILKDLDMILATNKNFLLGMWLEEAKSLASTSKYQLATSAIYEFNARNQITLWGPNGEILDHAIKQWSGIINDYLYPRWELFFVRLEESVLLNTTYDQDRFKRDFIEHIGKPFTRATDVYPTKPVNDSIAIAKKLYKKWRAEYKPRDKFWEYQKDIIHCTKQCEQKTKEMLRKALRAFK